jgi:hypothetical protein
MELPPETRHTPWSEACAGTTSGLVLLDQLVGVCLWRGRVGELFEGGFGAEDAHGLRLGGEFGEQGAQRVAGSPRRVRFWLALRSAWGSGLPWPPVGLERRLLVLKEQLCPGSGAAGLDPNANKLGAVCRWEPMRGLEAC